jgi:serine/threonine protein kinase
MRFGFPAGFPMSDPPASVPPDLAALAAYTDVRELNKGGMGVVYVAKNRLMGRLEVLKVVNEAFVNDPNLRKRFLREIQAAAQLSHPNIVVAYSAQELGRTIVMAMEYVPGENLADLVKRVGPLPVPQACAYAAQVAAGLQHAHERNFVHRDIKPSNVICANETTVKVVDFGLAKVNRENLPDSHLTATGASLGTPLFMAPEQARDATAADIRADIYSLGATLYFLLSGRPPILGKNYNDIIIKLITEEPDAPIETLRPDVPPALAAVMAKMLRKNPAERFATPAAVAHALQPFAQEGAAAASYPYVSQGGPAAAWGSGSPLVQTKSLAVATPIPLEPAPSTPVPDATEPGGRRGPVAPQIQKTSSRRGVLLVVLFLGVAAAVGGFFAVRSQVGKGPVAEGPPSPPPDPGKKDPPAPPIGTDQKSDANAGKVDLTKPMGDPAPPVQPINAAPDKNTSPANTAKPPTEPVKMPPQEPTKLTPNEPAKGTTVANAANVAAEPTKVTNPFKSGGSSATEPALLTPKTFLTRYAPKGAFLAGSFDVPALKKGLSDVGIPIAKLFSDTRGFRATDAERFERISFVVLPTAASSKQPTGFLAVTTANPVTTEPRELLFTNETTTDVTVAGRAGWRGTGKVFDDTTFGTQLDGRRFLFGAESAIRTALEDDGGSGDLAAELGRANLNRTAVVVVAVKPLVAWVREHPANPDLDANSPFKPIWDAVKLLDAAHLWIDLPSDPVLQGTFRARSAEDAEKVQEAFQGLVALLSLALPEVKKQIDALKPEEGRAVGQLIEAVAKSSKFKVEGTSVIWTVARPKDLGR